MNPASCAAWRKLRNWMCTDLQFQGNQLPLCPMCELLIRGFELLERKGAR